MAKDDQSDPDRAAPAAEHPETDDKWRSCLKRCRNSRHLLLAIVAIALLLDNMLLTTVVPIIPSFLYQIRHPEGEIQPTPLPTMTSVRRRVTDNEEEEGPQLLPRFAHSAMRPPASKWMVPGATLVPSEEFWPTPETSRNHSGDRRPEERENAVLRISKHDALIGETVEVGVMFASKPIVQAITNPFVGSLCNRIGFTIPMFAGFVILFLSTLIFAVGRTYPVLFIARSVQGVGSACTSVAGMGMLADRFPDDRERGNAMAIALGGLALGVLIGPPFGGVMYEFVGKASPFLVLAALALLDGLLQLCVLQPRVAKQKQATTTLGTLIRDPYILLAAGAITFANLGIAILEPSLPIWMMDTMNSPRWQQGAAFLPASISYLIGTNLFGPMGHKMGRWLASALGLVIIGVSLICIPLAHTAKHLIAPNAGIGFAIGMVDSSMMPMLGYLVDIRHTSVYGSVYAIGDVAFSVSFALGPAISAAVVKNFGFNRLVYTIAGLCFLYAPLLIYLRKVPKKEEDKSLLRDCAVRYAPYTDEETPGQSDEQCPRSE